MNGSADSVVALSRAVSAGAASLTGDVDIAVCPPAVFLPTVAAALSGGVSLGSQTVSEFESGAYTGEIAPSMLTDVGCAYAIVGHSERRHIYGESDAQVAAKCVAANDAGLIPIICVGETLDERDAGKTEETVGRQLDAATSALGVAGVERSIVAYEPVWAIGTGKTASPEQAEEVHAFIRGRLASVSATAAEQVRILYGGSVKGANAAGLFAMTNIDGGLIGGAALDADDFLAICSAAKA